MIPSSPTAVLFPGQGSQVAGMRDVVADVRPDLLALACELVGEDPFTRVDASTAFAQPAIFCASLASWTRIADRVDPVAMAGHSLGELTALTAAGAISDVDALTLVFIRGQLMAQAGLRAGGTGTMLAVLGGTPARAAALAARHGVTVANDNAPDQVVLAGDRDALMGAGNDARSKGLRAAMLEVTGAFHSPAMAEAVEPFRRACAEVAWTTPAVPVVSCATGRPFADPARELPDALVSPVRWREAMLALDRMGVTTYVDVGPGRVLARLVPRTVADAATASATALVEAAHVAG